MPPVGTKGSPREGGEAEDTNGVRQTDGRDVPHRSQYCKWREIDDSLLGTETCAIRCAS